MKAIEFTGSISEGTMRPQDIAAAIMDVLFEYHPDAYQRIKSDINYELKYNDEFKHIPDGNNNEWYDLTQDDTLEEWSSEMMSIIINGDMWDAMQEIAPEGHYFGAHVGDGSDYGFWLVDDYDVDTLPEFTHRFFVP